MSADASLIWQYLLQGDILGFIQALYSLAFGGNPEIFWVFLTILGTTPIYIRTKSFLLISVLFFMIGTLFLVAMPMVSTIAILLMAIGIGGILWQLFLGRGR